MTNYNVPNYRQKEFIARLLPFSGNSYKGIIIRDNGNDHYILIHWKTVIAEFDAKTGQCTYFNATRISVTTSKYQGRIFGTISEEHNNYNDVVNAYRARGIYGKRYINGGK